MLLPNNAGDDALEDFILSLAPPAIAYLVNFYHYFSGEMPRKWNEL
jgi:hypothetical protein